MNCHNRVKILYWRLDRIRNQRFSRDICQVYPGTIIKVGGVDGISSRTIPAGPDQLLEIRLILDRSWIQIWAVRVSGLFLKQTLSILLFIKRNSRSRKYDNSCFDRIIRKLKFLENF